MALEFNCPHCKAFYKLDEKFAGKMGKCKNPKCLQSILIPFRSTAPAGTAASASTAASGTTPPSTPIDTESLAASAFAEEPPQAPKEQSSVKKIAVKCPACDHKFEVDATLAGKNARCPECGTIIRVQKPVEDKPADWRVAGGGRPSMAKTTEPVPTGAWDAQRKGVSAEALLKAGALEVEDDEDPRDRRIRRIKQALYGTALLGVVVIAVVYFMRTRTTGKQDQWMDRALKEIEDKETGSKKPEFLAAIHQFAGEYYVRAAQKADELAKATAMFDKSRTELQGLPFSNHDRNAMLVELGVSLVACGGDADEVNADRRLPWNKVYPEIRKCLDKVPPGETELRARSMRRLVRKLDEKDKALSAVDIARNCSSEIEQPEMIGRVGIELFLMGKKDLAAEVLKKATPGAQPALTALWLAVNSDAAFIPPTFPSVSPPAAGPKGPIRESRLAYAEGYALRGDFTKAKGYAAMPGGPPSDRAEAYLLIAAAALDTGKSDEAAACLEVATGLLKHDPKGLAISPWLQARGVELAAKANRMDTVKAMLDLIKDASVKSWAQLEVLRIKLAGQKKEKADESWVEIIPDEEKVTLGAAMQRAEVARHNAAAGESSYTKTVEATKGILKPFGMAGTALGGQDRITK